MCGLELEAGWLKSREDLIKDDSLLLEHFKRTQYIGELVLPPCSSLEELFTFCEKNWPDEVTERCSMHVHVSFKNITFYSQTMTEKFFNEFLSSIEKWGIEYPCANVHFWNRLFDKNKYCRRRFNPEPQLHITKDTKHNNQERRTILNYSYGCHKTLECRLFPAFINIKTAFSAIEHFVNFVENYLEANPPNNEPICLDLSLDNEDKFCEELVIKTRFNYFDRAEQQEDSIPVPVREVTCAPSFFKNDEKFNAPIPAPEDIINPFAQKMKEKREIVDAEYKSCFTEEKEYKPKKSNVFCVPKYTYKEMNSYANNSEIMFDDIYISNDTPKVI